jgi:Niemann-Pick C1 protein
LYLISQIVPFVIFGVGLDDSYILVSAYVKTDRSKDPIERLEQIFDEVGTSIFMTTATSVVAFALGTTSSLPAIRWLCIYSCVTISIDFYYQVTFFIAIQILDEQRIQANRRDCLVCSSVKRNTETSTPTVSSEKGWADRVMEWYCDVLFLPWVKPLVMAAFAALFVVCTMLTLQLKVDFDFTSVLPDDSYVHPFNDALQKYVTRPSVSARIIFRDVDQSDPSVQAQMEQYVADLSTMHQITDPPFAFWLKDYKKYKAANAELLQNLTFNETIHKFVTDPDYNNYVTDFVFDETGTIVASRTSIDLDQLDSTDTDDSLNYLRTQRRIGAEQPINKGTKEWPFFTFDEAYFLWEFLSVTMGQLIQSTICGLASVSLISLLFLPHWTGVLFVFPITLVLYVDLMGVLKMANIHINGGTMWM